jgi:hypothetical protein
MLQTKWPEYEVISFLTKIKRGKTFILRFFLKILRSVALAAKVLHGMEFFYTTYKGTFLISHKHWPNDSK